MTTSLLKNLWRSISALFFLLVATFAFTLTDASAENPKKVVIISASYGAGHNTSANSIKKQMETLYPGIQVKILYAENYMRFGMGEWSKGAFNRLYQNNPDVYTVGFNMSMRSARGKKSAAEIPQLMFKENQVLRDLILENPDLVFSTHHISTSMLISLRERGEIGPENFKIGWVDTDFVHEPFFYLNSLGIEKTFMAHPRLTEVRIGLGVPGEKMASTGLPLNPVVFEDFSEADRRQFFATALDYANFTPPAVAGAAPQVGDIWLNGKRAKPGAHSVRFDPDVMTVTISSGKAGLGDYPVIFSSLVTEAKARGKKLQVIAVCGENEKNFKGVTEFYNTAASAGKMEGITLMATGLIDNSKLMKFVRSSALYIGKSGSQSPLEAAIMGTPSVLIDVFGGGQEHETAKFFDTENLAVRIDRRKQETIGKEAFALIESPERMEKVRAAQKYTRESYTMQPIEDFARKAFNTIEKNGRVHLSADPKINAARKAERCKRKLRVKSK